MTEEFSFGVIEVCPVTTDWILAMSYCENNNKCST